MQSEADRGALEAFAQVANARFALREREAAQDLIRDGFRLLPWELQDLYHGVVELYYQGKREQASRLFEMWMERAKDLGLI